MFQLVWIIIKAIVDDLDVGKSKTVLANLKKLSEVIENEAVKNTKFITLKVKRNNLEKNSWWNYSVKNPINTTQMNRL